jgi:hypothetical protein
VSLRVFRRVAIGIALAATMPLACALAQAPPPSAFPGTAPTGPAERIVYFEAEFDSIQRGESLQLRWEALNTYSVTIEPGVGAVATRGLRRVSPNATTTYTLSVTGTGGTKSQTVTVVVKNGAVVGAPPIDAAGTDGLVPRLADGKPDLSGVYMGGRAVRLVEAIVLRPGAEAFLPEQSADDLGQGAACLPPGVPGATLMPFPLQIVHKPDMLVIVYEAYSLVRIIRIDAEHPIDLYPTWMGHSVARWEGDTLAVDVTGFNDRTRIGGYRHTEEMHVTERYRRTGYGTIEYEAIVTDPNVFAEPVRYAGDFTLHPEWEIGEYFCTENAKDYDALFEVE